MLIGLIKDTKIGLWCVLLPKSSFAVFCCHKTEAYSKPSQTFKMKVSTKIVEGLKQLNISAKSSIFDVWLGSESVCVKVDVEHQLSTPGQS